MPGRSARISAGSKPGDIVLSPDGSRAYVVNSGDDTLSVLDLDSRQQIATIPVGAAPQFLALSPDGKRVYVSNSGSNTVSVVDLDNWEVIDTITAGGQPQGIAVTPDGAMAYVANRGENTISVVDLSIPQQTATIPTGSEPVGIALTNAFTLQFSVRSATDDSRLEYDGDTGTYTRIYPNGPQVHFNPDGRHDYTVDRHGNKTTYTYNPEGTTATMSIIPAGETTPRWTWDFSYQDGKLSEISDPAGRVTTFSIDGNNHLTAITGPDAPPRRFAYDQRGLMTHETDENYDAIERLTGKSYPDGSFQSFTYTANSRLSTAQQTMSGHTTEVSFDYDALGSVQEHVQTVDGLTWSTSYTYDYAAGTTTATYPSGTQVVKSLDTLSRLSQVLQDGVPVAGYSYNVPAGTVTQTHGNALTTLVETDPLNRVTRLSSAVADYRYGYDNVGNRTYMQRAHKSGAPADVYQYDNLYQLTQVWYGADATKPAAITTYDRLQAYTLDPVGNRLEVENDGVSESYLPNDGQKLTNPMHRYEQVDGQTLGYDLKGNLLEDGENTYTYDVQNQQIGMSGPGGTAEYVYDALGRRMAKIVDGVTTYFVYNAFYQVLEERDGSNQLLARYTYGAGIDEVLTMERGGSAYPYHRDALGSITEVTNPGGSLVERYEYDAYGATKIFDSSDTPLTASAIGNPYLFTGRRYDPESGNYYYRARMYSPVLGRFLQMDPLGFEAGDLNLYRYVFNSPLNFIDPDGKAILTVALAVAVAKALSVAVDYGLTAWDIYQAEKVLANPCAPLSEKLEAAVTIALAATLEAVEPDECFLINLPFDDLGRKMLMSGAREAIEKGGMQGLEKYLAKRLKKKYVKAVLKMLQHLLGQELEEGRPRTTGGDFPSTIKHQGEWIDVEGGRWVDIDSLIPIHPANTGPIKGEAELGYIDHADALVDEIKTNGFDLAGVILVMPVEDGRYIIESGHHRVEAL